MHLWTRSGGREGGRALMPSWQTAFMPAEPGDCEGSRWRGRASARLPRLSIFRSPGRQAAGRRWPRACERREAEDAAPHNGESLARLSYPEIGDGDLCAPDRRVA